MIQLGMQKELTPLAIPSLEQIITINSLDNLDCDPDICRYLQSFSVPPELLTKEEFERPELIKPDWFPNFESLWERRDDIRHLKLLPVKTDEEYNRYHASSKEELVLMARKMIETTPLTLAPNEFRYWLPDDLNQHILWVREDVTDDLQIWEFLAKVVKKWDLKNEELIIFERTLKTKAKIVRGSLPEVRHLHFWTKKKG